MGQGLFQLFPHTIYYFRVNISANVHLQFNPQRTYQKQSYLIVAYKEKYWDLKHLRRST